MATKKQIAANKRNAQQSTGPRTVEGRQRSSMNSVKHGLTATSDVLFDEDPAAFQDLHQALAADLMPTSAAESEIVELMAKALWRLKRVPRLEAAILEFALANVEVVRVQSIAEQAHNQRRVERSGVGFFSAESNEAQEMLLSGQTGFGRILHRSRVAEMDLGALSRYESKLMRSFKGYLSLLETLRKINADEPPRTKIEGKGPSEKKLSDFSDL